MVDSLGKRWNVWSFDMLTYTAAHCERL